MIVISSNKRSVLQLAFDAIVRMIRELPTGPAVNDVIMTVATGSTIPAGTVVGMSGNNTVVIAAHGLAKKTKKLRQQDIDLADDRRKDHLQRKAQAKPGLP